MGEDDVGQVGLPRPVTPHFCMWCGSRVPEGSRFCVECGRFLADPGHEVAPGAAEPTIPRPVQVSRAPRARHTSPRDLVTMLRSSRWSVPVATGLAVLLVVGLGGFLLLGHLRDRPVREALATSQTSLQDGMRRLERVEDLEQLRGVARSFAGNLPTLRAQERSLAGSTTELGRAGHRVVAAQVALTAAVSRIADAETDGFAWWGPVHDQVVRAETDLVAGTRSLATVDEDSASEVVEISPGVDHLERVVGETVADATRSNLRALVGDLAAAPRTASIREVAEAAGLESDAVRVSAAALDEGSTEGKALASYAAAYQELGALAVLDADNLDAWAAIRGPLSASLSAVAGPDDSASGRTAVANVDTVVRRGEDALKGWKGRYDAAVSDKKDDLSRLKDYRVKMDGQLRTYSSLRGELSNWIDRVEDPSAYITYDEAYTVLGQASSDRYTVRDTMNKLDKPGEVVPAHQSLLAVIGSGIAAVDAAFQAFSDAQYCETVCYYRDSSGWARFRSESTRITAAYAAAVDSWQGRVTSIESSISSRKLPDRPEV